MTPKQAADLLKREEELRPLKQAFADGKVIEHFSYGAWCAIHNPSFSESPEMYRIKLTPKIVPYSDAQLDGLTGTVLRRKHGKRRFVVTEGIGGAIQCGMAMVLIGGVYATALQLLENYEHLDGSLCGVKEVNDAATSD